MIKTKDNFLAWKDNAIVCLLTYLVYYMATKELKTKPTQVADTKKSNKIMY